MEVSQIAGIDTHAIIGGGEAKSFRMAETAEFFEVLSNTLYRDKTLAVVREVACNAWDSHIASGITDKPFKIDITDTELVIQDFGRGIPAHLVGDIYCVYGASTKVKDSNQTGGFGLGSKAPFAYADHFSVTTCHNGKKHLYAISRGSDETEGKPDFREMVCVDTEETGVRVSIPLKQPEDRAMFLEIATRVVKRGGMRAEINGRLVEGYDYSKAKHGFCLVPNDNLRESTVYCLYGTVLYPITPSDDEISDAMSAVVKLFPYSNHRIVIIAPPNSVGVTPSRESLSYTDRTKKTILDILTNMAKRIRTDMKPLASKFIRETTKLVAKRVKAEDMLNWRFEASTSSFDSIMGGSGYRSDFIFDVKDIAKIAAASNLTSLVKNSFKVVRTELCKLPATRDFRRLLRRRANMKEPSRRLLRSNGNPANIDIFRLNNRVLFRRINKLDLLGNLYFFCHEGSGYHDDIRVKPIKFDRKINSNAKSPTLNVYISFNQRDAQATIEAERKKLKIRTPYDMTHAYPVIILKRKQHGMIAEIKKELIALGLKPVEVKLTAPPAKAEKVEKSKLYHSMEFHRENNLPKEETLETAKYFVRAQNNEYGYGVSGYGEHAQKLHNMFGDIAITLDAKHEAKLIKDGAVPLWEAIYAYVDKIKDNKLFLWLYSVTTRQFENSYREPAHTVINLCQANGKFTHFFFPPPRAKGVDKEHVKTALEVLQSLVTRNHAAHEERNKKINELLTNINKNARQQYNFKAERADLNKKYKAIQMLQSISYYADLSKDEVADDVLAVIKTLVAREAKRNIIAEQEEAAAKVLRDQRIAEEAKEKAAIIAAQAEAEAKRLATPPAEIVKLDSISVNAPEKMKEIFTKFHALPSITTSAVAA